MQTQVKQALASYSSLELYNETIQLLRTFFRSKNFLEVETQSRRSILAACEDPTNITSYTMSGVKWPLPQTGQMWLEYELLKNPDVPGLFCSTTSYRDEKNPQSERHLRIFPMFEFETHGGIDALQNLITELLEFLGFGPRSTYHEGDYQLIAQKYNTKLVEAVHENRLLDDYGHVYMLKYFPVWSQPFWNMKRDDQVARKIDTILYGVETIGAAERGTCTEEMRDGFYTISEGLYARLLFEQYGQERVEKELEEFLKLSFFERCGGGIGLHRLMRARALRMQELDTPPIYATKYQTEHAEHAL